MTLVAAISVDANGDKYPLGLVGGATENAATVQALIDNLAERGLDPGRRFHRPSLRDATVPLLSVRDYFASNDAP